MKRYTAEDIKRAYRNGYAAGYKAGEQDRGVHSFPLADDEADAALSDEARARIYGARPDAEAERLRARMLDLDPYSP